MKKIIAFITAVTLMVGIFAVSVFATNKSDLLTEAAKSPVYKYVKVAVENAARTVEITDEQAEQILPIVKRGVALIDKDNGPTYSNAGAPFYTKEQMEGVFECIDEICKILGFTWKMTPKSNALHIGDGVLQVFDQNNKLIFEYDGDVVSDTSAASDINTGLLLAGAALLFAAGAASIAVSKKRIAVR